MRDAPLAFVSAVQPGAIGGCWLLVRSGDRHTDEGWVEFHDYLVAFPSPVLGEGKPDKSERASVVTQTALVF